MYINVIWMIPCIYRPDVKMDEYRYYAKLVIKMDEYRSHDGLS